MRLIFPTAAVGFAVIAKDRAWGLLNALAVPPWLAIIVAVPVMDFAVLIFEVLLNAISMFNHGNVRMLAGLDCVLRWIVVTPDMHRVHHSILPHETNSNFGFDLPW